MAEGKKNLVINTGLCDARSVKEETLAAYAHITIHAGVVLTSPEARALMARYAVQISAGQSIDAPMEAVFSIINGSARLTPGQTVPKEKRILLVNGSLEIEEGCETLLESYVAMVVNGSVEAPRSLLSRLDTVCVNGSTESYPDGCIRLGDRETLDRTFALRVRQGAHYYAGDRILALAPDIDFAKMAEKQVRFTTEELVVAESLVETAVPLFSEQTRIQIVPDGCMALEEEQVVLSGETVKRCGGRLMVNGDVLMPETGPWLETLSFLRASGCVRAVREAVHRLDAIGAKYGSLHVVGGTLLRDMESLRVTRAMLENAADGLSVDSCDQVVFDADIPPALLREKLVSVWDCSNVRCGSQAQLDVITPLTHDVCQIGCAEPEAPEESREDAPGEAEANPVETVHVNSASYVL